MLKLILIQNANSIIIFSLVDTMIGVVKLFFNYLHQ